MSISGSTSAHAGGVTVFRRVLKEGVQFAAARRACVLLRATSFHCVAPAYGDPFPASLMRSLNTSHAGLSESNQVIRLG